MLYLVLFIIIIIIIIFYFINNYKILIRESFEDVSGALPTDDGSAWGNGANSPTSSTNSCILGSQGSQCSTENGFGVINIDCECIVNGYNDRLTSEEEINQEEEGTTPGMENDSENRQRNEVDLTNCFNNNSNFDKICRNINPKYGIKELTPCDANNSKVECALNYLDGTFYGNDVTITPCLNKSDDFNNWCKYYNNSTIPTGYNVNSIGSKHVLVGEKGGCFLNNGNSDTNLARAVCDYNHMESINKLNPINDKVNYNIYTKCYPLKNTNFVNECNRLFENSNDIIYADQIIGYDCNPGYGRAKCVKNKDVTFFNNNIFTTNTISNENNVSNVCSDVCDR